jgi:hypothetical protein
MRSPFVSTIWYTVCFLYFVILFISRPGRVFFTHRYTRTKSMRKCWAKGCMRSSVGHIYQKIVHNKGLDQLNCIPNDFGCNYFDSDCSEKHQFDLKNKRDVLIQFKFEIDFFQLEYIPSSSVNNWYYCYTILDIAMITWIVSYVIFENIELMSPDFRLYYIINIHI